MVKLAIGQVSPIFLLDIIPFVGYNTKEGKVSAGL